MKKAVIFGLTVFAAIAIKSAPAHAATESFTTVRDSIATELRDLRALTVGGIIYDVPQSTLVDARATHDATLRQLLSRLNAVRTTTTALDFNNAVDAVSQGFEALQDFDAALAKKTAK